MKQLLLMFGILDRKDFLSFVIQFIKFGIVGVSNTLISLAVYYFLIYLGINYLLACSIGFVVSVANAYYWNSRYVFKKSDKNKIRTLLKTYSSYGITFFLSLGLMFLMVDILGISEYIAPLVNLCITIPINFLLNKFWAFS